MPFTGGCGRWVPAMALIAILGAGWPVSAAETSAAPQFLVIEPPPEPFGVSIWVDEAAYRPGDRIDIHFYLGRGAFVYIIDHDTRGRSRLIFPNRFDRDNYFARPGTYTIPRGGEDYRVEGPPGIETLEIIASSRPLTPFRELIVEGTLTFPLIRDLGRFRARIRAHLGAGRPWGRATTSFRVEPLRGRTPPVARFIYFPDEVEVGERVTFDAGDSFDPDGTITRYEWDLDGDGQFESEGRRVFRSYGRPGLYEVTLSVIDDDGRRASRTETLRVERGHREPPRGRVPGYLGVRVDYAAREGGLFGGGDGLFSALVNGIVRDSPAERAGLSCGDWIVAVRAEPSGAAWTAFASLAERYAAGEDVVLLVAHRARRSGDPTDWWFEEIEVRLAARPDSPTVYCPG
ncbi:MAG TPA: PKD domain-containing protein [Limnochordia bacterium]